MSNSARKQSTMDRCIERHSSELRNDENPYATPQATEGECRPTSHRTNFQLQRLGFTLRAHALLSIVSIAVFVVAFALTDGIWPEVGAWLFISFLFLFPALALTTFLLVFEVFPIPVAVPVFASMFVPITWPFSFIGIHLWGRSILRKHSMQLGIFKGPQYVAKLAQDSE